MDSTTRLLERVKPKFTVEDITQGKAEAVSVITVEDLNEMITTQVRDRTAQLAGELKQHKTRVAELEKEKSQSGGLERAAAEAALEAEARALDAQAAAEVRAEQAEAKLRALEAGGGAAAAKPAADDGKLKELETKLAAAEAKVKAAEEKARAAEAKAAEKPAAAPAAKPDTKALDAAEEKARAAEARAKAADEKAAAAEAKVTAADEKARAAEAKVADLEKALAAAKSAAPAAEADDGVPAEPVTPEDHKKARRLVDALLEDVVSEDEAKVKASVAKKTFRKDFEKALGAARKQYVKRVKAAVRADKDHWDEALAAIEAKGS